MVHSAHPGWDLVEQIKQPDFFSDSGLASSPKEGARFQELSLGSSDALGLNLSTLESNCFDWVRDWILHEMKTPLLTLLMQLHLLANNAPERQASNQTRLEQCNVEAKNLHSLIQHLETHLRKDVNLGGKAPVPAAFSYQKFIIFILCQMKKSLENKGFSVQFERPQLKVVKSFVSFPALSYAQNLMRLLEAMHLIHPEVSFGVILNINDSESVLEFKKISKYEGPKWELLKSSQVFCQLSSLFYSWGGRLESKTDWTFKLYQTFLGGEYHG